MSKKKKERKHFSEWLALKVAKQNVFLLSKENQLVIFLWKNQRNPSQNWHISLVQRF